MSCNCGCHDDRPPATGWRKFVPLIVGLAVAGALIAGAVLKNNDKTKAGNASDAKQASTAKLP
ncbi:MAG: hypothetical protein WC718_02020 [Phycisphaerales bacterium]